MTEKDKDKNVFKRLRSNSYFVFISRTVMYSLILVGLIYLYHFSSVGGGSFIYNQF